MCGIAGLWTRGEAEPRRLHASTKAMTDTLAHRGPDASGVWTDAAAGVGLGHRRLSILDLSPTGAQPMASPSGRFVVTYNGEIFNSPDLRRELEAAGARFRGTSDTEVMLAAFDLWGFEPGLQRLVGLFAFALWDRQQRELILVRDRLGKKPLFWSRQGGTILFGSELKALAIHPEFRRDLDRAALAAYLRYAYVPAPMTIFSGVEKVPPGAFVRLSANGRVERKTYWDLRAVAAAGLSHPRRGAAAAIEEEAHALLRDAVGQRMLSDVPLGAFLSGGIDSSLVVALMQAQSSRPVRTFSIGYAEASYDESGYARAVAKHLGTDHTEMIVTAADALAVVPKLADWYDEPFSDSSQIPTHLVSALARRKVTVALSGDGGDEIAAGYVRHYAVARWWPLLQGVPLGLRRAAGALMRAVPVAAWDAAAALVPASARPSHPGDKAHKFTALLDAERVDDVYRALVTQWAAPGRLLPGVHEPHYLIDDRSLDGEMPGIVGRLQYLDMATYLPDDILCKVDRASMAVALEVRCPLLDHRVVEFFWTLPRDLLAGQSRGKLMLRSLLQRYVPPSLFERQKMGFGLPIGPWLRGPLRDWAEDLIGEERLRREGIFAAAPIREAWRQHVGGRHNHQYRLWNILMFQAWYQRWGTTGDAAAASDLTIEPPRLQSIAVGS
jgi:asparagine synthase (glutamine-hydrolysing)